MRRTTAGLAMAVLLTGPVASFAQTPAAPPAQSEPKSAAPDSAAGQRQDKGEKPGAAPAAPPATPPASSAAPAAPPATPPADAAQRREPFGEEITLVARTVVLIKGAATWDSAFDTLLEAFKTLSAYIRRENLTATGAPMVIYTATEDTGFQFEAAIPIGEEPKSPPSGDIRIGKSPTGKAVKFVHRGSYDAMDTSYELITNYLDDRRLEAKELFIEEYATDPLTTPEDKLVINVLVPLK